MFYCTIKMVIANLPKAINLRSCASKTVVKYVLLSHHPNFKSYSHLVSRAELIRSTKATARIFLSQLEKNWTEAACETRIFSQEASPFCLHTLSYVCISVVHTVQYSRIGRGLAFLTWHSRYATGSCC